MMDNSPAELLDELGALRRRTRADQHGYWLPLLVFGVLVLAAPLAYSSPKLIPIGPNEYTVQSDELFIPIGNIAIDPLRTFQGIPAFAPASGVYWLAAIVVGLLASVVWYRWRANRVGVQPRIRTYLWPAFGALALFVVASPLASIVLLTAFKGFGPIGFWVDVAIAVAGIAIVVVSALRRGTPGRRSLPRRIGLVAGIVIAAFGLGNLGTLATVLGFGALYVIALGLVAMAWMERSILCAVIAGLFLASALLTNLYDVENWLNVSPDPFNGGAKPFVLIHLALPVAILLIGAIVALIVGARARAAR
jgi:hypothetical protein